MRRNATLPLILLLVTAGHAAAQESRIEDIDAYLREHTSEVALARSAAPDAVSSAATILVFERDGYREAVRGTNGFTCMVMRSWLGPFPSVDARVRAPICFNPQAAASVLERNLVITERMLAGASLEEALAAVDAALAAGELHRPAPGALGYMLSGAQWLNERVGRWRPHLMFYAPDVSAADVGGLTAQTGMPWVATGNTRNWGDITVPLDESAFVMTADPGAS